VVSRAVAKYHAWVDEASGASSSQGPVQVCIQESISNKSWAHSEFVRYKVHIDRMLVAEIFAICP
jgi:hypothetical protein